MKRGPTTPKGFRDIQPELAEKRRDIVNKISDVLRDFGFRPIETPTLEFADTLLGKYGEEEKLIYQFMDKGGRNLALRYDLTVPLARFVANNLGLLNPTFSRYQVGQVFRGENPQKGRYRELTQFDFDTVGSKNLEEDAKVIAVAIKSCQKLGLKKALMLINDRQNFNNIPVEVVRAWDKLYKIGIDGVKKELVEKGFSEKEANEYTDELGKMPPTNDFYEVTKMLESIYKLKFGTDFIFDRSLARGLDYYTGLIFEMKPADKPQDLSIGGGGRYDNLIGMFAGKEIPAVGFSFGLDRLVEVV